mmetsp:Transcript_39859/g.70720  ORF Transcript_39859/g.70720 Transcript_39859/m.70720 type:complete len:295 (-) Transcript_39859:107-991(-)
MTLVRLVNALVLASLACIGHGRRLQTSSKQDESRPVSQGTADPHHALAAFLLAGKPTAAFHASQSMLPPGRRTLGQRQKNLGRPVTARSFPTVMSEDGEAKPASADDAASFVSGGPGKAAEVTTEKPSEEKKLKEVAVKLYEDEEGEEDDVKLSSMSFEDRLEFLLSQETDKDIEDLSEEEKAALAPSILFDDPDDKDKDTANQATWAFYGFKSIRPWDFNWLKQTAIDVWEAPEKEGTVLWRDALYVSIITVVSLLLFDVIDAASNNFWRYIQLGAFPDWSPEYVFKYKQYDY